MSLTAAAPTRRVIKTDTILRAVLSLMLGLGCVSFIEPSPYEFLFFILLPVTFLDGFFFTRTTITLFFILFTILFSQFLSLIPHFEHSIVGDNMTPALYTFYSLYLYFGCQLFALIFSKNTSERISAALKAYAFSCVFAGAWGILSFINFAGIGDREPIDGRIAGPFKDPNVLGSYCIMGVLFFVQSIILDRRHLLLKLTGAGIAFVGGVFLSLSRGSLGAMIFGLVFLLVVTFAKSGRAVRKRIMMALAGLFALLMAGGVIIAADQGFRENVTQRAKLEQEYDGGETGRFGNQKRSIPMLMDRPLGFGSFRFPLYFGLQPHNSYIGAFSDGGWVGGFAFLFLVLGTSFFGLRLCLKPSPFMRYAHVITPAALGFFLQGLQIDIDHWRFVLLMIGAIWGMESARRSIVDAAPATKAPEIKLPDTTKLA